MQNSRVSHWVLAAVAGVFGILGQSPMATAQGPAIRYGAEVPSEVRTIYQRGLSYLVQSQAEDGHWASTSAGHGGPGESGITGLCLMAFLASGEDPNFGQYSATIRRGLRHLIQGQEANSGYLPGSMYHHGFGMLALAEAYGTVDDRLLWDGGEAAGRQRTIGEALDLAVRCAVTSQKNNPLGGWRYNPESTDADTSVSGAVLMGLLAARNAGIEVPDDCIDKALGYFKRVTGSNGGVGYTLGNGGESPNRTAIAALVYAIGKRKETDEFKAVAAAVRENRSTGQNDNYLQYFRYYTAQALFQADFDAWQNWNADIIRALVKEQQANGSFNSGFGTGYGTAMSLLTVALNYRFLPIYER